jgi:hypothetical protein
MITKLSLNAVLFITSVNTLHGVLHTYVSFIKQKHFCVKTIIDMKWHKLKSVNMYILTRSLPL